MNRTWGQRQPRGVALMLVLAVVATATILGFAMLSSNAVQVRVSHNVAQATSADFIAESAVQAALYYLQYPSDRPASWTTTPGYYIHATGQTLDAGIPGTFDLEVREITPRNHYTIRAVGRDNPNAPPRVVTARASVARVKIGGAAHFGGDITIPVRANVSGVVKAVGSVTDNSTSSSLTVIDGLISRAAYRVPTNTQANYYGADRADRVYVMPDGTVGYAQQLSGAPLVTPLANLDNPGRVFFYESSTTPNLNLTAAVIFNGTLVVRGGDLSIRAPGIVVTPLPGMPAMVLERNLNIYRTGSTLEVNGAVYVGGHVTWTTLSGSSLGSRVDISGSLLMPGGSVIGTPGTSGQFNLLIDSTLIDVPDLSSQPQPGTSVRLLAWND